MADEQAVIKRMEQYAKAAARKVLQKFGLGQDEDRHEDISQTLFLAGWDPLLLGVEPAVRAGGQGPPGDLHQVRPRLPRRVRCAGPGDGDRTGA